MSRGLKRNIAGVMIANDMMVMLRLMDIVCIFNRVDIKVIDQWLAKKAVEKFVLKNNM